MDLQITVCLLFILFAGGHSFSCHQCSNTSSSCNQASQCPTGISNCLSATATGNTTVKVKSCAPASCPNGSVNLGIGRVSSVCCNTDLCNAQDAPDLSNITPNGKMCYYCDGQSCSNTVSCSGSEDRCFNATASMGGQSTVVKGCASKSICDTPNLIPTVGEVSCCEGNLCNSAQSVTRSFLLLGWSLLSFILLH
ncbi:hypothetical protein Q8A67_022234 [Cirrhinus molitorella]|uniref:UPAR/Ly6 domain-containing protein n=1 Tax=Cirrhinus molitorella TaxID=172907 RepID=A0AA88P8C2_9TELE|nr:hypothetical protein Q8A67_022234 [Cirrhinus molitorella]